MKLDPTVLRTMGAQDFQVLEAIEKGMLKHALVPAPLIVSLSNLRHGGTHKILSSLLRDKLLSHDRSCGYDGYRITTAGYDIMTLHNLKSRKIDRSQRNSSQAQSNHVRNHTKWVGSDQL